MIALPPLLLGAVQLTVACPFPGVADTPVGAPGTVAGVAEDLMTMMFAVAWSPDAVVRNLAVCTAAVVLLSISKPL